MGREAWLLEISVLCIMAGLVCLALGMRRREAAAERFKNSPQNVQETFIKSGNIAPGPSVLEVSDKSDERRK